MQTPKWQYQLDEQMQLLNLRQVTVLPQLFYQKVNGRLVLLVAKIVDDQHFTGDAARVTPYLTESNERLKLQTVVHGPGQGRFYGLHIVQHEDMTSTNNGNEGLHALESCPFSRFRRSQCKKELDSVEKYAVMSLNSSVVWLRITPSQSLHFILVICSKS